jgi:hypothetical protein
MDPDSHPQHIFFSPARIRAIAGNTLLELIRLKVFYFLLIFGFLLIGLGAAIPELRFQEQFELFKSFSYGAMSIFTWLLSVLATAMLLPKDIEDRTLYTILAKPVPRFEYLLGKLLGVLLLLLISTVIMALVFGIALWARLELAISETVRTVSPDQVASAVQELRASAFTFSLIPGVAIVYLKASVFAALTLFISTFASSWIFTIIISTACLLIGHLQGIARDVWLGPSSGQAQRYFLLLITLFFPDNRMFSAVDDIVAGNSISMYLFGNTVALGGFYIVIYFLIAYFVFAAKEL